MTSVERFRNEELIASASLASGTQSEMVLLPISQSSAFIVLAYTAYGLNINGTIRTGARSTTTFRIMRFISFSHSLKLQILILIIQNHWKYTIGPPLSNAQLFISDHVSSQLDAPRIKKIARPSTTCSIIRNALGGIPGKWKWRLSAYSHRHHNSARIRKPLLSKERNQPDKTATYDIRLIPHTADGDILKPKLSL